MFKLFDYFNLISNISEYVYAINLYKFLLFYVLYNCTLIFNNY